MRITANASGRPAPAPEGTGLTRVYGTFPLTLTLTGTVLSGDVALGSGTAGTLPKWAAGGVTLEDSLVSEGPSGVEVRPRSVAADDYTGMRVSASGEKTTLTALSAIPMLPDTNPSLRVLASGGSSHASVDVTPGLVTIEAVGGVSDASVTVDASGTVTVSGAFVAPRRVVVPHVSADVLTEADAGKTHTNEGATSEIILTLPAATVGLAFRFASVENSNLVLSPASGEAIDIPTEEGGPDGQIATSIINNAIDLECLVAGRWTTVALAGSWAFI